MAKASLQKINHCKLIKDRSTKDSPLNFRSLVTPVFAAVVASVAAFVLLVVFAAGEQDDLSLKSEQAVLNQEMDAFAGNLETLATDNAWWDTAVNKILLEEDLEWIDYSIGATAQDMPHVDGAIIVRPDLSIIYAYNVQQNSGPDVNAQMLLATSISDILGRMSMANSQSRTSSGLLRLDGRLIAYGASLVRANDETNYATSLPYERPVLMFYAVLSEFEIDRIGTDNAIEQLVFSADQPDQSAALALENTAGVTIGWLSWKTRAPGTEMALDMVWPALILLLAVSYAMARFLRKASSLVDGLEQASRSKTSFLASMSHEVRTPLNSILGFAELMSLELFGKIEGDKNKEYLQLIKDSGGHLLSIINDILDISKLEAGKFEVYSEEIKPDDVILECIRMVEPSANDQGITLTHHCEKAQIHSDERILRQILINVLSNAIKFTERGGAVHIIGECKKAHYQALITDNGIGMSQTEIDIALSTFGQVQNEYSKKHSGTGLGLPLVKRFITLLDGNLDISSYPGKGTTVTLIFPYKTRAKKL